MSKDLWRQAPLFAELTDEQFQWLSEHGKPMELAPGDLLFSNGNPAENFYILIEGEIKVTSRADRQEAVLNVRPDSRDAGKGPLLIGSPNIAHAQATRLSRLLCIRADDYLHTLIGSSQANNLLVTALVWRIQNTEAMLHQREKLAALGKLSASLAHELNNPSAAIGRTAGKLRDRLHTLIALAWKFKQFSSSQLQTLADFQFEATQHSTDAAPFDIVERSDREDQLAEWLEAHHVPEGWKLAPTLVRAGLDTAWIEQFVSAFDSRVLPDVLAWVEGTLTVTGLLEEIELSAGRVSEMVNALKGYSYMDQAPVKDVDIHAGLESTLVILRYKLNQGMRVTREYDPHLPRIHAYGSELNQVWTNLIDNAIDATGGQGHLHLRTALEGDTVLVEVIDDGPGVPPEIQSRIFEPFFSTKQMGKGLGLGLDICYRIVVNHHQGDISVRSMPGETRFQVRLPVLPSNQASAGHGTGQEDDANKV